MLSFSLQIAFWHLHLQEDSTVKPMASQFCVSLVVRTKLMVKFLVKRRVSLKDEEYSNWRVILLGRGRHDHVWAKCNWSTNHIWLPVLQCQEPFTPLSGSWKVEASSACAGLNNRTEESCFRYTFVSWNVHYAWYWLVPADRFSWRQLFRRLFFFFLRSILSDFVVTSIVLVMITPPDWYNGSSILISLQSCYLWLLSNAA